MSSPLVVGALVIGIVLVLLAISRLLSRTTPGDTFPVEPAPVTKDPPSLEPIRALAARGEKIMAIKAYRELTGKGLAEAKHDVEALVAGQPVAPVPARHVQDGEVERFLREGQFIPAIKAYRERTGLGLAESKAAVEKMRDEMK